MARVIVALMLPSSRSSLIPATVTVCALFQLPLVNVSSAVSTMASPVSPEVTEITTSLAGWAVSTTVNVSVEADSATRVEPPDWVTVKPAELLSVVVFCTTTSNTGS